MGLAETLTETCPVAPVVAVFPPGKVALAPFAAGTAANVTVTPLTAFPLLSVTVAIRGFAKGIVAAVL